MNKRRTFWVIKYRWNSYGNEKIQKSNIFLCNKYENSGLKNVDIFTKVASLQCSWIKRLFDNNFHEWKAIPFYLVCRNWWKYSKFHSNLEMSCSVWSKFPKFYQELFLDGVNILLLQLHYHQQQHASLLGSTGIWNFIIKAFASGLIFCWSTSLFRWVHKILGMFKTPVMT